VRTNPASPARCSRAEAAWCCAWRSSITFSTPPPTGGSQGISLAHLDAATAVWNYCEESVQMLFKTRTGTLLGDKVLSLLADGPMTKDKLNDHLSPKQKQEIGAVLVELEAAGQVIWTKEQKGGPGRPSVSYTLPG
jgi:hypothetical protein